MSTGESLVRRETGLVRPSVRRARAAPAYARLLVWPGLHKIVYLGGDLAAITLAHMLAVRGVEHFLRVPVNAVNPHEYHRYYIPFFAVVLYLFDGYKSPELRRPEQELERSCKAVAVSFLGLVLFNFVVFRSEPFSRYLLAEWSALAGIFLVAVRFSLRAIQDQVWKAGMCRRRAVLIGSGTGLSGYLRLLSIQRHRGYELMGILTDSTMPATPAGVLPSLPLLGSPAEWESILRSAGAEVLIVARPADSDEEQWMENLVRRCKHLRVDVEFYSGVLATANLNYEHDEFSGCFRFYAKPQWSITVERILKRGIDIAIGLAGSAVAVLMTPVVFALVNLEDPGPVFHEREFVGTDGRIHYYRKFRTMLKDADEILSGNARLKAEFARQYKLKNDPRMLRVGRILRRYSLDGFPEFFSVLSGKLTFVGPRVISAEEKRRYGALLPKLLSCKPGLTGFWQVMGRQTTTYQERIEMDMFYIDRWSIWLDLVIIAKTFWIVLKAEGAY